MLTAQAEPVILPRIPIHIIDTKIPPARVESLYATCAQYGLEMVEAEEAQVILTVLKKPLRLARYLPLSLEGKMILVPEWIEDSAQRHKQEPMEPYLVPLPVSFKSPDLLKKWQDGNVFEERNEEMIPRKRHREDSTLAQNPNKSPRLESGQDGPEQDTQSEPSLASFDFDLGREGSHEDLGGSKDFAGNVHAAAGNEDSQSSSLSNESRNVTSGLASAGPVDSKRPGSHPTRYSCLRSTPLTCPNQGLVDQLSIIRHFRDMEGEKRSELSYSHAIAALKAWPKPLTSLDSQSIGQLNGVGKKIAGLIEEYLETGSIARVDEILANPRYKILDLFWNVYDAGSVAVRRWAGQGLESIEDVLEHAHLNEGQRQGLKYYHDFGQKMSRANVNAIVRILTTHLIAIEPSTEWVVCGGYRRGKEACNDIDLIITTRTLDAESRLLSRLMVRLESAGLLTGVLYFTEQNSKLIQGHSRSHRHAAGMDPLDKAFIIFNDKEHHLQRRVDLILAPREQYGTAILGWSGSKTFERDLRLFADKERGLKFDSGGIYRNGEYVRSEPGKEFWDAVEREGGSVENFGWEKVNKQMERRAVEVEKVCFDVLGLAWVEPSLRNVD